MLACRPMLSFALAVMAGVVAARYRPDILEYALYGWLAFFALAVWFCLTPKPLPAPPETLPVGYAEHIFARPGFLARRGLNRFVLIACFGFILIAASRQNQWREYLSPTRLPEARWFDAHLIALAPIRDHVDETGAWRVPAILITVDGKPADGPPVRLSGRGDAPFRRGDIIQTRVRRDDISPRPYPGAFDFRGWLERDGLAAALTAEPNRRGGGAYTVAAMDDVSPLTRIRRAVDVARSAAIGATLRNGGEDGPMLAAMLYGYRKDMADDVQGAFRRVGIGHVLAISGLHVGLIVGLLWWLSGWFNLAIRWRALSCLALAIVYLGLSGGQVAAARATLMAVIHLVGIAGGRRSDMLNSLGAAAFFIVLANPGAPFDVSFQLSFTAVVFIYLALRREPDRNRAAAERKSGTVSPAWRRIRQELVSLTRLSVAAGIGLFPIIAVVFNQVNLIGLPINVVVIPLMSLVLEGGLLLPLLGWIPGAAFVLRLPSRLLTILAMEADRLPYSSIPAHAPSGIWVFLFYAFVLLLLARNMVANPLWRRRWTAGVGAGLALSLAGMIAGMGSAPPPPGGRVAVLPSRGMPVISAESAEGGIALLGTFARFGLNEAEWLHHLRRGGAVGVVAVGSGKPADLSALSYHYPVAELTAVADESKDYADADAGWRPVPGAPGVEYAVSRDGKGRLVWLAARAGGQSVCVAPRLAARQFAWRLERSTPGFDADLVGIGFADRKPVLPTVPAPRGAVGLMRGWREGLPAGWFDRRRFGVLVVADGIRGFDGREWKEISEQ